MPEHNLVPSKRIQLYGRVEAIEVEVLHGGTRRRVLVHEREGGAGHLCGDAISLTNCLDERRLPRPELSGDRDDERRMRRLPELPPPLAEMLLIHRKRAMVRKWGNERRVIVLRALSHRPARPSAATLPRATFPPIRAFTSNS